MNVAEIMTRDVQTIAPDDTIQTAAKLMDDLNVGILPVHDGTRVVGVITDRDITVRATSMALSPKAHRVGDCMTEDVYWRKTASRTSLKAWRISRPAVCPCSIAIGGSSA